MKKSSKQNKLEDNGVLLPQYSKLLNEVCSEEVDSYSMDHVKIEDSCIVATDGKRLSIIRSKTNLSLSDGLYLLKKNSLFQPTAERQFPNWRSLLRPFPNNFAVESKTDSWINCFQWECGKRGIPISIKDNLKLLTSLAGIDSRWVIYHGEPNEPISCQSDNSIAKTTVLIMPFGIE